MSRIDSTKQIFGKEKGKMKTNILLLLIILFSGTMCLPQEILDMPKPIQFEAKAPHGRLVLIKKMSLDIDNHHFLAFPRSITIDDDNAIYIYDARLKSIFKFDEKYTFITRFLSQGRGPAEVSGGDIGIEKIYYSPDGHLYVRDIHNDKLIQFTKSGKNVKDIRLNRVNESLQMFLPVVDKQGFFYAYSLSGGIVDKMDSRMNIVHTYLNQEMNRKFVVFKSRIEESYKKKPWADGWLKAASENADYEITPGNQLVIYLRRSSKFFVFNGKKLVHQFQILPKEAIKNFRIRAIERINRINKLPESLRRRNVSFIYMFGSFFLDKDDSRFFYLQALEESDRLLIYKFNLKGVLVKLLSGTRKGVFLLTKRNNRFFGLLSPHGHPVIFKEHRKN